MKKIISGVLIAAMLTSVLCACNDGGNQSNSSQSGNNADSSQPRLQPHNLQQSRTTRTQTVLHRFRQKIKPISLKKFHLTKRQYQMDSQLMTVNFRFIMQLYRVTTWY